MESRGFYFSSDNLSNNQLNVDSFWDGSSVYFNLKNNINGDLITDYDIRYSATCEVIDSEDTCTMNGTNSNTVTGVLSKSSFCVNEIDDTDVSLMNKTECEVAGYTWDVNLVTSDLYFDVDTDSDVSVRITVTSTSPYRKTLTGIFNLYKNEVDNGSISYNVNHYDVYDELIITNSYDSGKCVSVSFNNSKRVANITNDMSNITYSGGYANSFNLGIGGFNSEKVVFYSKDGLLNFSDIVVSETNEC